MNKAGQRRIERALSSLIEQDGDRCSLRHTDFTNRVPTFYGVAANGKAAVVGECCAPKLQQLYGVGLYFRTSHAH
jgi:hypothetical protein